MRREPRVPAGPTARLAALVLALFALGWLADRAHVALESHRWCAEHGRVEHAQDEPDAAPGGASGPRLVQGSAKQHHACWVLLARGENPAIPVHPPAGGFVAHTEAAHPRSLPDAWVPSSSVPLLLLAPKQSPPRA